MRPKRLFSWKWMEESNWLQDISKQVIFILRDIATILIIIFKNISNIVYDDFSRYKRWLIFLNVHMIWHCISVLPELASLGATWWKQPKGIYISCIYNALHVRTSKKELCEHINGPFGSTFDVMEKCPRMHLPLMVCG